MGYNYALVHLTYTLPPALLLTTLTYPLLTRLDLYKLGFLVTIAVAATIPWDSYLIRHAIWSYPSDCVLGPKILSIPIEEVFFFVIQTYNTTLLYLLLSKPVLHSVYLAKEPKGRSKWKYMKVGGQLVLALAIKKGAEFVREGQSRTYLGLIIVWAGPFLWLLWSLAYQFLVRLPLTSTLVPIAIPTVYLWAVDTVALRRGTWIIEAGTKTGVELWPGFEMEEALFFALTNTLIVAGLVAFDNAVAVLQTFPLHFPEVPALPSPVLLMRALLLPSQAYDEDRILGLQESVKRLRAKSRSFYLASSTFQGRLRIDLIILYSFCRVADDLIDTAASPAEAREWVGKMRKFLDLCYGGPAKHPSGHEIPARDPNQGAATQFIMGRFPAEAHLTLLLLPTDRLANEPLYELLKGFEMDLQFSASAPSGPIRTETDLDAYGARVAGTVALLCIQLVMYHYPDGISEAKAQRLMLAGHDMGIALQYVNIARDLSVDAKAKRVYVPPGWLKKEKLTPESFLSGLAKTASNTTPSDADSFFLKKVAIIRGRLLDRAFEFYGKSRSAIEELPREARAPMRVAVESYMQIGRELRKPSYTSNRGRATVPVAKRLWVGWRTMLGLVERQDGR